MDTSSDEENAIIPEDRNAQLSLPAELVQRGLELAVRIEQKNTLQKNPEPARTEYIVRGHMRVMEWFRKEDGSMKLRDIENAPSQSLYLAVSVDKEGVHIALPGRKWNFPGMDGNEDRFRSLTPFNARDPFRIPFASLGLYYRLTRPADDLLTSSASMANIPKEARGSLSFETGPSGGVPGYKGPALRSVNGFYDINRDCVKTVIIYISIAAAPPPSTDLVSKNPPVKLDMVVINEAGENDLVASRELYHAILEHKDPESAAKLPIEVEDVYGSIPPYFNQSGDWQKWTSTYEGRTIRTDGFISGASFHPNEGKAFFILTVGKKGTAPEANRRRLAVWIDDARQVSLGVKEGSFLINDTCWLCLGEACSIRGWVAKYAWFDNNLRNTEFDDLVIVKVRLKDIA